MTSTEKIFIETIRPDSQVLTTFLCTNKSSFVGKTGLPYLSLTLVDKTGSVDAKVWDNVDELTTRFEEGDFVKVKANATVYNTKLQLRVSNIRAVDDKDIDPTDYFQTTPFNIDDMLAELRTMVEELQNPDIRRLILSFLDDPVFIERYTRVPAAKSIHHAYLGGLLEHTLSLAKLAERITQHYPNLDRSLLMAGVFFHDIGKIRELSYDRGAGYTDEGRLLGHIVLGVEMLNERIRQLDDFPEELRMLIGHMILSHHGTLEFGSPKRPKILEAHVLGVIDDLDARVNSWQTILDAETAGGRWSTYQRLYDRYLYRWQGPEIIADGAGTDAPSESGETAAGAPSSKSRKDGFSNSIRISDSLGGEENADPGLPLWKKSK